VRRSSVSNLSQAEAIPVTSDTLSRAPRIAVVGDVALDLVLQVGEASVGDEKADAAAAFQRLGGTGANAAAALAALGDAPDLIAAVGDDPFGEWVSRAIESSGVSTEHLATTAGSTTLAVVVLGDGRRSLIVHRGVADSLLIDDVVRQVQSADLVYLSGQPLALCRAVVTQAAGMVVLGLEARQLAHGAGDWLPTLAPATAVLTNRAGGSALLRRRGGRGWPTAGSPTLVVTQGPSGCTVYQPGRPAVVLPALEVTANDATGAGDCFAAAFCHWLSRGSDPLAASEFATVAAGLSTTAVGAQGRLPSEAAVLEAAHEFRRRLTSGAPP
jgi:sulfofructose kinase